MWQRKLCYLSGPVTGVDFSKEALKIAKKNVKAALVPVKLLDIDVTKLRTQLTDDQFDFVFDYSLLHHIRPTDTNRYARQFTHLLKKGGKILLVCYSEKDEYAQKANQAKGKYGNTMYYRTADTIREAYKDFKELYYKEAKLGKRNHHLGHCFFV